MEVKHSRDLFKSHWIIWKAYGIIHPKKYRIIYFIWLVFYHFAVTFFYPLHLIVGLVKIRDKNEIFKNLSINLSDVICSLKFILIWYHLKNIRHIENILTELDKRILTSKEKVYFRQIVRNCKCVIYSIAILYIAAEFTSELSTFIGDEKHLLYPAWFPIDWRSSATKYWIVNMYQFIGISTQTLSCYASDTYPPVILAILSGHIRLLSMRLSVLGTDPRKSRERNNKELKDCFQDHVKLIKLYDTLKIVLSMGMFFQILVTGLNMCFTIFYLVFCAKNLMTIFYYSIFLLILPAQIFPSCYFGTMFEMECYNLPYALFSCNWMDQDKEFKQNLLIFSERCLKIPSFYCMGFFKIHVDTFFKAIKSSYSLFAVVLQVE